MSKGFNIKNYVHVYTKRNSILYYLQCMPINKAISPIFKMMHDGKVKGAYLMHCGKENTKICALAFSTTHYFVISDTVYVSFIETSRRESPPNDQDSNYEGWEFST